MKKINKKKLISLTVDIDLHDWFKIYAADKRKSVSSLINDYMLDLSSSLIM